MITMKKNELEQYFSMVDGDKILGKCKYDILTKSIVGFEIEDETISDFVKFNLLKAVLNYFDLHGVKKVFYNGTEEIDICQKNGFKNTDEGFCVDLNGYFEKGCANK